MSYEFFNSFDLDESFFDTIYLNNNTVLLEKAISSFDDNLSQNEQDAFFEENFSAYFDYENIDDTQISKLNVEDALTLSMDDNCNLMNIKTEMVSPELNNHVRKKRPYRLLKPKKCIHVWEFCRDLLRDADVLCNNELVEWVNKQSGVFRFKNSQKVSYLWGLKKQRKKNKPMTFEKMTRGIRYSETQGYFGHIRREERIKMNEHKFKFGRKAIENCEWLKSIIKC